MHVPVNDGLPRFVAEPNPDIFNSGRGLVCDLETTNADFGSPHNLTNRIVLSCFAPFQSGALAGPIKHTWGGENEQQELVSAIRASDFLIAHNAKFELGWLRRCGLDLRKVLVYDTMLAEWVLLGNQNHLGLSLEASVERHGITGSKEFVGNLLVHRAAVETTSIPKNWLLDYCRTDVDVTARLAQRQLQLLNERKQLHLVYQRGLACACLTDIEFNGLRLDKEAVFTEHSKVLKEYLETKESLETYGDVNWKSPKQVTEFLYDVLKFSEPLDRRGNPLRTATGNRSASEEAISSLVPRDERQREFIGLFKKAANLNAKLSKTLDFFKGVCEHYDSTFYGNLNQGTTDSHRLSSSGRSVLVPTADKEGRIKPKKKGVQFQNQPREYKRLIKAKREGWLVLEIDYAQLEFRAAAALGNDAVARAEIEAGADIHSITAQRLSASGEPTSRQDAKSRTFRPLNIAA